MKLPLFPLPRRRGARSGRGAPGRFARAAALFALPILAAAPFGAAADDNAPPMDRTTEWLADPSLYMVAIEALVVEVNEDKSRDLGLHYGMARNDVSNVIEGADFIFGRTLTPVQTPALTGRPDGTTDVGFAPRLPGLGVNLTGMDLNGQVLSARLRALLDKGDARITTRPIAMALNGTKTLIQVGTKVPYQDVSVAGVPVVSEGNVGVKMEVLPKIIDLARETVELDVTKVEVSSLSNYISTQNIDRPVFTTADTRTKITLHSGETYQLSSLKGRREREVREGVPILMHIPVLKWFFSSKEQVLESVDILFFVTPHIVPPGQNVLLPYDFAHNRDLEGEGLPEPRPRPGAAPESTPEPVATAEAAPAAP